MDYDNLNAEQQRGYNEGIELFLYDTLEIELEEETNECWLKMVREKIRPNESEDWYEGARIGLEAEFGED